MLIENYDVEFETPDCQHPSCYELFVKVTVEADLTELLPYVNALVNGGEFIPGIPVLVWTHDKHKYALRPHEIAINNIEGRENGMRVLGRTIEWLNGIWNRRDDITPDNTPREKPKILDVYKLLPHTNCKECGLPSCMGFAGELVSGNKSLEDCAPLLEEVNSETRRMLLEMGL